MGSVVILVRFILFLNFFASNFFRLFGFGIWGSKSGFAFELQGLNLRKFLQFCYIISLRDVTGHNDI